MCIDVTNNETQGTILALSALFVSVVAALSGIYAIRQSRKLTNRQLAQSFALEKALQVNAILERHSNHAQYFVHDKLRNADYIMIQEETLGLIEGITRVFSLKGEEKQIIIDTFYLQLSSYSRNFYSAINDSFVVTTIIEELKYGNDIKIRADFEVISEFLSDSIKRLNPSKDEKNIKQ